MLKPPLPPAPSWYPGHMSQFTRLLPAFLTRTDIVIELRDARLPLTSINPSFESAIAKWQHERRSLRAVSAHSSVLCERIVVLGKKDLVGQWGISPFCKAMQKMHPGQRIHFTSHTQGRTVRELSDTLVSLASRHALSSGAQEVNVLVVGMPNVGKSTLLNALRATGISGPTPKALQTSANPGLTRAISTRLKLSLDPLIYAFDSPGVMLPFLGRGDRGAERGVKLALIAGIKKGLYDVEALAAYLVYRLWVLAPSYPAYMTLLPASESQPADVHEFLDRLATRLCMIKRGGELNVRRAARWFVQWWREVGGLQPVSLDRQLRPPDQDPDQDQDQDADEDEDEDEDEGGRPGARAGWGFDFEWDAPGQLGSRAQAAAHVQGEMEARIEANARELAEEGEYVSSTQERKREREDKIAHRRARWERRTRG